MRKLGQHFLKNKSALQSIAESLDLAPSDVVIEIGPGHGELTEFLVAARPKKIVAIEKDENLYSFLTKKFQGDEQTSITHGDVLKMLPVITHDPIFMGRDYKIAGNIPYYITGHLFRIISELDHKPEKCSFTIQKEVAERICAAPPQMNRLAASVQFWASAKIIKTLLASDFNPPPKVSSAIIVLDMKELPDLAVEYYYSAVRAVFAQPRKTLTNNIAKATDQKGDIVAKKLSEIGIPPDNRPQNLNINDVVLIARTFFVS